MSNDQNAVEKAEAKKLMEHQHEKAIEHAIDAVSLKRRFSHLWWMTASACLTGL